MDDDFLTKCFEGDPKYIQLVLRIVMEMPDLTVVEVRTQVFVENLLNRSVRLDVLATDSAGRRIDANLLPRGEDFDRLPETYVIFIPEHDVIGDDQPLYKVERTISGSGRKFGDGSYILYVNGACRDESPIGRLMHDFSCADPADMYYDVLAERVRFFKECKEGVSIMCKAMEDMRNESLKEGLKEGMEKGIRKGRKEEKQLTVLRMLEAGKYALEEVAQISGLSLDEVKRLQAGQGA